MVVNSAMAFVDADAAVSFAVPGSEGDCVADAAVPVMDPIAGTPTTNPASLRKALRDMFPELSLLACSPDFNFSSSAPGSGHLQIGAIFHNSTKEPIIPRIRATEQRIPERGYSLYDSESPWF
jgi:hypothetical protein